MNQKWTIFAALLLVFSSPVALSACKEEKRTCYSIVGEYDGETRTFSASEKVSFCNNSENVLSEAVFHLVPNAFSEGKSPIDSLYYNMVYARGESFGSLTLTQAPSGYAVEGEFLTLPLSEPLYPGEYAEAEFSFQTVLPDIDYRFGVGERVTSLTDFFPELCPMNEEGFLKYEYTSVGDPYFRERADFSLTVTLPQGVKVAADGIVSCVAEGGKQIVEIEQRDCREPALFLGDFNRKSRTREGLTVDYYFFEDEKEEETFDLIFRAFDYFSDCFGAYRGEHFYLAESDYPYGGMEYSRGATVSSLLRGKNRIRAIVHEIAHQWWYYGVGNDGYSAAWQDEGLAEYSAALFFADNPEYGVNVVEEALFACRAYYSIKQQTDGSADLSMTKSLKEFSSAYDYEMISYRRAVVMLDEVKDLVGKKTFLSCCNRYYRSFCGKTATVGEFLSCFPRRAQGLFLSFLEGKCVV